MAIKVLAKFCSVAATGLLVFAALGPAKWQVRTGFGWQIDHLLAYFAVTPIFCLAWPQPFVVGGALSVIGALLEGLQVFTPDRTADLRAAFYGAGGAMAAALLAKLLIRARTSMRAGHRTEKLVSTAGLLARSPFFFNYRSRFTRRRELARVEQ
jgi:VanZ family protein